MANKTKSPTLAAILSFFVVGLGQIYNGDIIKGIVLFLAQIVNIMLMFFLIGFFLYPLVWIYSVYNAYITAKMINEDMVV